MRRASGRRLQTLRSTLAAPNRICQDSPSPRNLWEASPRIFRTASPIVSRRRRRSRKSRPFPANHHPLRWGMCHLGGPMRFRRRAGIAALFEASSMRELKAYEDDVLLDGYLAEAVWFWFDASTVEKRLECGLHRVAARCILSEIRKRGLDVP